MSGTVVKEGEGADVSSPSDVLGMSDEDFLNQGSPVATDPSVVPEEEDPLVTEGELPIEKTADELAAEEAAKVAVPVVVEEPKVLEDPAVVTGPVDPKAVVDPLVPKVVETPAAVDPRDAYEADYKKIMAPFQANGKTIELKSPEEAIKLMQMGANYTKKMQDIAPQRAVLMMLEKNGLLNQDKLSYLIDLDKKNPDAIRKLIKDSGIDPLDFDPKAEPTYTPGNHQVDAAEVNFNTVLDDLKSTPAGMKTLRDIHDKWDDASKTILWSKPGIMNEIHKQQENGIYGRITDEVDRRKTLGQLAPDVVFLDAYELVGNELAKADAFADLLTPAAPAAVIPEVKPAPVPVAIRPAAIKPQIANSVQAQAASNTRAAPTVAKTVLNPLSESDEDFMKRTGGQF